MGREAVLYCDSPSSSTGVEAVLDFDSRSLSRGGKVVIDITRATRRVEGRRCRNVTCVLLVILRGSAALK